MIRFFCDFGHKPSFNPLQNLDEICIEPFGWYYRVFNIHKKRLVSSAKSRMLEPISCAVSFLVIKSNNGLRIEPWGTPAGILDQSEQSQVVLHAAVSVIVNIELSVTGNTSGLWIRPVCHTLSNAWLISRWTTLISFPASNAWQKVLYRKVSWYRVTWYKFRL